MLNSLRRWKERNLNCQQKILWRFQLKMPLKVQNMKLQDPVGLLLLALQELWWQNQWSLQTNHPREPREPNISCMTLGVHKYVLFFARLLLGKEVKSKKKKEKVMNFVEPQGIWSRKCL